MDEGLKAQYGKLVENLEEPIREIVPAIWDLPFIVDTGHTCSGHALAQKMASYGEYSDRFGWYPHRAILELYYSVDPELVAARDGFRNDLTSVLVDRNGLQLRFDDIRTHEGTKLHSPDQEIPHLWEMRNADVPELEKSEASVDLVESMLVDFWEQVAAVVRKYNPGAKIGPIKGKNFRRVINWSHWRGTMIK